MNGVQSSRTLRSFTIGVFQYSKMLDSIDISRLYENVLDNEIKLYNISPDAIKFGIECMAHVYGETAGLNSERSQIADYTDPAHRCAYLHKYAALHTAMVRDMLGEAVAQNYNVFHKIVFSAETFRLCCLGGGPGTDVIGVLSALHAAFGYFDASATVVDYMAEWSCSFSSILKELGTGWYGAFGNNISYCLNWRYVGANLLKTFKPDVLETLSSAAMVTMVKFTSAAACMDTRYMIRNIFTAMRPGAALLFIDNDGGGFHQLIEDAADEFMFIRLFGPLRRENYLNAFFKKKRFGYFSCCKTTVSVQVLQKPFVAPYFNYFPSDPYMVKYKRVLMETKPLLSSPPTPFLYLGENQDKNNNILPNNRSPSTPFSSSESRDLNSNGLVCDVKLDNFSQGDVSIIREPGFVTPQVEIPQSPSPSNTNLHLSLFPNSTPLPRGGKRGRIQGCFPIRIANFRHHIGRKLNQVKARARSVFKQRSKKKEKKHPIFKL